MTIAKPKQTAGTLKIMISNYLNPDEILVQIS